MNLYEGAPRERAPLAPAAGHFTSVHDRVASPSAPTLAIAWLTCAVNVLRGEAVPRFQAQPLRVDPACVRPPEDAFKRHDHARPSSALRGGGIRVRYRSRVKLPPSQSLLHTQVEEFRDQAACLLRERAQLAPPRGDLRRRLFAGQSSAVPGRSAGARVERWQLLLSPTRGGARSRWPLLPWAPRVVVAGTGAQRPRRAAPCAERRARSARRRSGSPQAPGAQRPRHRRRARSARRRQLWHAGAASTRCDAGTWEAFACCAALTSNL